MTVNQISVFLENKPGKLAEMTRVLGNNGIDMRALSIADTKDYGIVRLMVDDPEKTVLVLKEAGWVCTITPVLAVSIPDQPGALERVLDILAQAQIGLEYVYAFLSHRLNAACMVMRVADNEAAARALTDNGVTLATQDQLYQI